MKKTTIVIIVLLVALIAIIVVSYRKSGDMDGAIKIGVISPLTGSGSSYGEPIGRVTLLAAEEINTQGGIAGRTVKVFLEDGKCDAKEAINAVNKLVNTDKVPIVLGGGCSTESLAIAPFLNQKKILQIAAATSANTYSDAGTYSFRVMPKSDTIYVKLGAYAFAHGHKEIAVLYENKDYPKGVIESFVKGFESAGGHIVSYESFPPDEQDLRSLITKIKATKATAIMFAAQDEKGAIRFFTQAKELGVADRYSYFTDFTAISSKVFAETAGAIGGNALNMSPYVASDAPRMKELLTHYQAKFGHEPGTTNFWVASSYDRLTLVKEAIEHCKGNDRDTDCLIAYLSSLQNWQGVMGTVSFDQFGDITVPTYLHYFDKDASEHWDPVTQ